MAPETSAAIEPGLRFHESWPQKVNDDFARTNIAAFSIKSTRVIPAPVLGHPLSELLRLNPDTAADLHVRQPTVPAHPVDCVQAEPEILRHLAQPQEPPATVRVRLRGRALTHRPSYLHGPANTMPRTAPTNNRGTVGCASRSHGGRRSVNVTAIHLIPDFHFDDEAETGENVSNVLICAGLGAMTTRRRSASDG
jgi:hypothetical protein